MASSKRAAAVAPQRMMKQSALNFSGGPAPKKTKAADDNAFKIYCDLDGVLTDFDAGVEKICGKRPSQISSGMLWSSIARAPTFFDDLEWCSDGQELWNAIRPHQPDILTGCSRAAVAVHKAAWCKRELCVETNHVDMAAKKKAHEPVSGFRKQGVTNVITCWSKNKHRESGPQCVLIDDRQDLQQDWEAAGGIFILHTDTTSSLRQLREKGIIKPLPEAKQVENQKAEEPNPATTTTTVISNLITMTTIKPPSEAKQVEKPRAEEPDPATTTSYRLQASASHRLSLILVKGSVLDFDNSLAPAAIVNAANVGCLGGGGVDGAISKAGGRSLDRDRSELPVVADADSGEPVRCPEGQAVVTGPGNYGSLHVPYVIHAVGPNYNDYDDLDDLTPVHNLLKSAYTAALDRAVEHKIQSVAFSLLSAGLYRGSQPLEDVLALGVTAIQEWSVSYANITGVEGDALLSQIVLYAFTSNEYETLKAVCDRILESKPPRAS